MTEQSYRLTFTEGNRSQTNRPLGELMENAQKALQTQGRLRSLLRASQSVIEQLDLPTVLRRIVEAAVELVDARYGALGVRGPDGRLDQFIEVGTAARAAPPSPEPPAGRGAGFVDVPVRVRGEVFGNLYLDGPRTAEFTSEDQELLSALAATAGSAIDHARLFDETERRQRWSSALAEITSALLSGPDGDPIDLVVDRVLTLADAELVCLIRETAPDSMVVDVVRGTLAPEVAGRMFEPAGTLTAEALRGGRPVVVGSSTGPAGHPGLLGPTMVVPMAPAGTPRGALVVSRATGRPQFTAHDVEVVGEFAAQTSVALELAAAREDQQRLLVLEERSRIAGDLHDHVIQRLFAAGLSLEAAARQVPDAAVRAKIADQVQSLDEAMLAIRTAIFALTAEQDRPLPLRHRIVDVLTGMAELFPVSPQLALSGPVDLGVPDGIAADLLAAVREGLTNVARHAGAHDVAVSLLVDGDELTLRITDDGIGIGEPGRRSGVANLERRAKRWGGTATVERRPEGGTTMTWRARLGAAESTRAQAGRAQSVAAHSVGFDSVRSGSERADDPRLPRR